MDFVGARMRRDARRRTAAERPTSPSGRGTSRSRPCGRRGGGSRGSSSSSRRSTRSRRARRDGRAARSARTASSSGPAPRRRPDRRTPRASRSGSPRRWPAPPCRSSATCRRPASRPVDQAPPGAGRPPAGVRSPTARSALPALWLAIAFQPACGTIWLGTAASSSSTVQKLGAALGLGPDPGDVGRRHERRLVAEVVADERRDRRDPLVVVAVHRDHHVRIRRAVDRTGQAVQHGADHVVLVSGDA